MKKFFILLTFLFLPAFAGAEEINLFQSDIALFKDGTFSVTETIVYDFGDSDRHGIYRFIPLDHWQKSEKKFSKRVIEIDVVSVTADGEDVPYSVSESFGQVEIKIGDPDQTITGEHTYVIEYDVAGGLSYYDNGETDLYWNATGNDWEVPINEAVVRVYDPDNLTIDSTACYYGHDGETKKCSVASEEDLTVFSVSSLSQYEGITVAQSLNPELVDRLILEPRFLLPFWIGGSILWFLGIIFWLFAQSRHHRTGAPIIAQYEPYEDFKPMYTGILFDGRIDPRDITAGIIHLAEQGFFRIRQTEQKKFLMFEFADYEIELLRPYTDIDDNFDKKVFQLLFETNAEVGSKMTLGDLADNTSKRAKNLKTIERMREIAESDLTKQGFFEYRWKKVVLIASGVSLLLLVVVELVSFLAESLRTPVLFILLVIAITCLLLTFAYRRRTRKGYLAMDYLKGFKLFLSVTDEERFKFHNSPKKSPEQFMAYLPYAIAFGVEKEWAEVFKDISLPNPDWYVGQASTFSAVNLSQGLSLFGATVASASGSSASSGGGSSGGGSGGGGGGSW